MTKLVVCTCQDFLMGVVSVAHLSLLYRLLAGRIERRDGGMWMVCGRSTRRAKEDNGLLAGWVVEGEIAVVRYSDSEACILCMILLGYSN